jgi:serine phosphatase RsbU (regulator of sigma subunit)
MNSSNIGEITLMSPGDILFLYSDGVYDGSDEQDRLRLEGIVRNFKDRGAKEICTAILDYALEQDRYIQQLGEQDRIDDKTAFIIKHF